MKARRGPPVCKEYIVRGAAATNAKRNAVESQLIIEGLVL